MDCRHKVVARSTSLAAEALRPGEPENVRCIVSAGDGQELSVQVRGYLSVSSASDQPDDEALDQQQITADLFRVLRGQDNLAFANSRADVELYAARLRDMCEVAGHPNEFFAHHGSLARELREEAEAALKDRGRPATAVATTTLEMGIDIGSVQSVAQLGRRRPWRLCVSGSAAPAGAASQPFCVST